MMPLKPNFVAAVFSLFFVLEFVPVAVAGQADGASGDASTCKAGDFAEGCFASGDAKRKAFWKEMRSRGLQLNKLKRKTVEEKAQAGRPARTRPAMVLADDVFYGRPTMKVPRYALLSLETSLKKDLRTQCTRFLFEKKIPQKKFNISSEDSIHMLSLAYPLIAERRDPDSVFREWLDAADGVRLFVLQLSERQLRVLQGTTVEAAREEMERNRDMIFDTADNLSYFQEKPVTLEEADWALAIIMRHSRVVHPHQDVRDTRLPRMYLFPLLELLDVQLTVDANSGVSFQEEMMLGEGKREEEMVVHIARRDMAKGEEVFVWAGRLSNSEMIMRHGFAFEYNPIGIGRNVSIPPNWEDNPESKIRKELEKYNCSTMESFELRLSPKGHPMRNFVRCYRISWFIVNGWYNPGFDKRMYDLNQWPPPRKYTKPDWLAWTQADQEVNNAILHYCELMRERLKDTMDSATAQDFRSSTDEMDKLLWYLRSQEARTFKACIALAKEVRAGTAKK
eukprot:TRINITY_DN14236_c0_g2_i1.p1 TRINITY_DN14236_c0_g2~~TRINITY_DN14236_c0_g2_i1.p1  ORF type:complete len:508 (-),score=86.75 TRINITY_DN14236_c0_g2_i1:90-1613(-)